MSANISIRAGNAARLFSVESLQTFDGNGQAALWTPKAEVATKALQVSENGLYRPSDQKVYAFDEITVNVPESGNITGRGSDGNEYNYQKDGFGGITRSKVPSSIAVTTPPNIIKYKEGSIIQYAGIVVTAYDANGESMGTVPHNELIFPVKRAVYAGDELSNGEGVNAKKIAYTWTESYIDGPFEVRQYYTYYVYYKGLGIRPDTGRPVTVGGYSGGATILLTMYNGSLYAMRTAGDENRFDLFEYDDHAPSTYGEKNGWFMTGGSSARTYLNRFVTVSWGGYLQGIPVSTANPTNANKEDFSAVQTVPVQWKRSGDGELLETTLKILVSPRMQDRYE